MFQLIPSTWMSHKYFKFNIFQTDSSLPFCPLLCSLTLLINSIIMHVFALVRHLGVIFWPTPFLSSYILSTTSTHWFYGLKTSHLSTFPILPTIEPIITISPLDITTTSQTDLITSNFFFLHCVPQSGFHIPKMTKTIHWGVGQ